MPGELRAQDEVMIEPESRLDFWARVVGIKPNHYLIVKPTLEQPISAQLKVNDKVQVVCFHPSTFRFKTKVIGISQAPHLIFLDESPSLVTQNADRRGSDRHKVFIGARCQDLDVYKNRCFWDCHILNISDSGCLILGNFTPLVDRDLILGFTNPWTGENIRARVRVVRNEATESGLRSGLLFIELAPDDQRRLDNFVQLLNDKSGLHRILSSGRAADDLSIKP